MVVDREAANWREKLAALPADLFGPGKTDPLVPVQLEVIDRATDEAIQRLTAAGRLAKTTRAQRPLFPLEDAAGDAVLSAEEMAKAKLHREQAARKLKLARVLGEGGFGEEARPALLEFLRTFATALAVEHRLPEPLEPADALQVPLAQHWAGALRVLKTFVEAPGSDWKPGADYLGRG